MKAFERITKSGDIMTELQKCPPSGKGVGCLLAKAPVSVKVVLMSLSSLLPSLANAQKQLQKKMLPPDTEVRSDHLAHSLRQSCIKFSSFLQT